MIDVTKRHGKETQSKSKSWGSSPITGRLRGEALYKARGSCSNCGRSIEKHNVVLVVDCKIPREWGLAPEEDGVWAICEDCREGKKSCFEFVGASWMRDTMALKSVHMRLGETLKAFKGGPVPSQIMDFVSYQDDWKKRARELRYLGWKIDVFNRKLPNGRVSSFYKLVKSASWPPDPTAVIRQYEQDRAKRNRNQ